MDLKSVLTIASFLFFAQVISQTGLLNMLAAFLQNNISNPKHLIMAIMLSIKTDLFLRIFILYKLHNVLDLTVKSIADIKQNVRGHVLPFS